MDSWFYSDIISCRGSIWFDRRMQCLKKGLTSSFETSRFSCRETYGNYLTSKAHSLAKRVRVCVDCLQSTFSLKIYLVLIPASNVIVNDITISEGIRTRWEKTDWALFLSKQTLCWPRNGVADWSYFFFSSLHPCLSWLTCMVYAQSNFAKKNKRLLAV